MTTSKKVSTPAAPTAPTAPLAASKGKGYPVYKIVATPAEIAALAASKPGNGYFLPLSEKVTNGTLAFAALASFGEKGATAPEIASKFIEYNDNSDRRKPISAKEFRDTPIRFIENYIADISNPSSRLRGKTVPSTPP